MNIDSIKSIIYMYILIYSDQGGRSAKSHGTVLRSGSIFYFHINFIWTPYMINLLVLCTTNRMSSIAYILNCVSALQRL